MQLVTTRSKKCPLYNAWRHMRQRCNNPNQPAYKDYGGRGITVCNRWHDYEMFVADVGPHPGKGWSIDRIDNSKGYEPGNVRWATPKEQVRNTRLCKLDPFLAGKIRTLSQGGATQRELATRFNVTHSLIHRIIHGERWI